MKKGVPLVAARVAAAGLLFLESALFLAQRADHGWGPDIATPRLTAEPPRVLFDEAALMTAQVSQRVRYGMNTPGNDCRQFALNVLHWLSRAP